MLRQPARSESRGGTVGGEAMVRGACQGTLPSLNRLFSCSEGPAGSPERLARGVTFAPSSPGVVTSEGGATIRISVLSATLPDRKLHDEGREIAALGQPRSQ